MGVVAGGLELGEMEDARGELSGESDPLFEQPGENVHLSLVKEENGSKRADQADA